MKHILDFFKNRNYISEAFQYYALKKVIWLDYYDRSGKRQKIIVSTDLEIL